MTVCDDWNNIDGNETTNNCRNALHKLAVFNRHQHFSRGYLEVRPLKDCQLYTVALSPATSDGHPVVPGEEYTSIHSTLCAATPSFEGDSSTDDSQLQVGNKSSNSELVVVLVTMILIGSAMVCLAVKSVTSLGSGGFSSGSASSLTKSYYFTNPASTTSCPYDDLYALESMKRDSC